jgi:hypothetical protein
VVRECATLTGKVVGLFDHDGRQLTSAHVGAAPNVRLPGIHEILARCGPVSVDGADPFIAPAGATGLSRRKIVAPVSAGDERFGWLVIDEHPSGFRALDRFVAERSAALLGSEFVVQRRVARVAWNAKTSLARQMVRGTQSTEDLMASADYLGVDTGARRVLAYVLDPTASRADESLDQGLAASVEQELGVEVLATRGCGQRGQGSSWRCHGEVVQPECHRRRVDRVRADCTLAWLPGGARGRALHRPVRRPLGTAHSRRRRPRSGAPVPRQQ